MPEDSPLDPVAKVAMVVNLLTEDNLPSYHREIATRFGRDGAWGTRVNQWTAEEGRHAIALRDYLVVTRGVDPARLVHLRMEHTVAGYESGDKTPLATLSYVSFQELANGIDLRIHHDEVLQPVLRFWHVFDRTDLGSEGQRARDDLAHFLVAVDAQAEFYEERTRTRALERV